MNIVYRTTNGYDGYNLTEFNQLLNTVDSKITSPRFEEIKEIVSDFVESKINYQLLAAKAVKGGALAIENRDQAKVGLVDLLHRLGNAVGNLADNRRDYFLESGLPFTDGKNPTPPLQKPVPLVAKTTVNKGQIFARGKRQKGSTGLVEYFITSTPNDPNSWVRYADTHIKFTFTNLVSGTEYFMKYVLSGPRKQRVESDPISLRPQ